MKLYKKPKSTSNESSKKKQKIKSITSPTVLDLYDVPKIKENNWSKWLENMTVEQANIIKKLNNVVKKLRDDGFVDFISLTLSKSGLYFIDYAWDKMNIKYPNMYDTGAPILLIVIKLDNKLHFNQKEINCQHANINGNAKKNLLKLLNFVKKLIGMVQIMKQILSNLNDFTHYINISTDSIN